MLSVFVCVCMCVVCVCGVCVCVYVCVCVCVGCVCSVCVYTCPHLYLLRLLFSCLHVLTLRLRSTNWQLKAVGIKYQCITQRSLPREGKSSMQSTGTELLLEEDVVTKVMVSE